MHTTTLENDVIKAIAENEYADTPSSEIWSFAIKYQTKITEDNQIAGVVSSLVKKGLVEVDKGFEKKDSSIKLTKKGLEEYNRLKKEGK